MEVLAEQAVVSRGRGTRTSPSAPRWLIPVTTSNVGRVPDSVQPHRTPTPNEPYRPPAGEGEELSTAGPPAVHPRTPRRRNSAPPGGSSPARPARARSAGAEVTRFRCLVSGSGTHWRLHPGGHGGQHGGEGDQPHRHRSLPVRQTRRGRITSSAGRRERNSTREEKSRRASRERERPEMPRNSKFRITPVAHAPGSPTGGSSAPTINRLDNYRPAGLP